MTGVMGRVRDALRGERRIDADAAGGRGSSAVQRFLAAGRRPRTCRTAIWSPRTPWWSGPAPGWRSPATTPWWRWPAPPAAASPACSTRWPGCELSPVGVRRPTTGVAHACVWGPLEARQPAARLGRRAAPAPVHPGERAGRRRRGRAARAGPARPARLRLGRTRRTGSRSTGCSAWSTWSSGWSTRRSTPTGSLHTAYLQAVPPAPRRHRRGAQPGRPAVRRRRRAGARRPARLLEADGLGGVPVLATSAVAARRC